MKKRSVMLAGHRTSISLEEEFWSALRELARTGNLSLNALVAKIDTDRATRPTPPNLSSALRLHVLECARRGELASLPAGEA